MRIMLALFSLAVWCSSMPSAAAQEKEAWRLLSSSKIDNRLSGVAKLAGSDDPKAEEYLRKALSDKDWEVVEAAAIALARIATPDSTSTLVGVAVDGPIRRVRLAAATALIREATTAVPALVKKARGDRVLHVIEALGVVGGDEATAALEGLRKKAGAEGRDAIMTALGMAGGAAYREKFVGMLGSTNLINRLAGLAGLARQGDLEALGSILDHLVSNPQRSRVEIRRCRFAVRDLFARAPARNEEFSGVILERFRSASDSMSASRMARLIGELGRYKDHVGDADTWRDALVDIGLRFSGPGVLPAVCGGIRRTRAERGVDRLLQLAVSSKHGIVRFHALRVAIELGGSKGRDTALEVIAEDSDADNREDAAALCGLEGFEGCGPTLEAALADGDWRVAVAAAVSIGKVRHVAAKPALMAMMDHDDWRRRGAAALSLAWFRDNEATDLLIDKLSDDDPCVRATIHRSLERITGRRDSDKKARWKEWWRSNRDGFQYVDLPMEAKKARDEGYARGGYGLFKDIDIVVLDTREGGDNIEELLDRLTIDHRLCKGGGVPAAKLHPFAIFVANCAGEIEGDDPDRLEWFVRAGGYMFASCWALTETIGKTFPGIASQHPTSGQVLDVVDAEALPRSGRFLGGVFRPGTRTRYILEGSHLIRVHDPERFEVLIDSPECAARWGEGNLAGWFTVGHGLVFDSANHFDLQGMKRDVPRKAAGRKAQAMDRLGYSHEEVRELEKKGIFKSAGRSSKELEDLSMFRLITNFVRQKRLSEL